MTLISYNATSLVSIVAAKAAQASAGLVGGNGAHYSIHPR